MNRRRFLTAAALASVAGCTGTAQDDSTPTASGGPGPVALDTLGTGLEAPLDVAFHPGSDLRYVAEQRGTIRAHGPDGLRPEPLLDLRETVEAGGEKGLLGIALHPSRHRRLFVRYSVPPREGTPPEYSHTFVLAEFAVGEDGLTARRDSERTILEIPQPQPNHNAGAVVFGPEGYLYVGVGDGGAGGDQGRGHVEDWYDAVDGGNGQDVRENLLGSILRLDVDGGDPYAVPPENPLVGREGLDEQYAWGFRNPWRLAVDGTDLYAGDVGQNRYEEIDRVQQGGNYGWNVREGTHCFEADDCPDRTPESVRGGEQLLGPVVEYPHSGAAVSGISVITGNVYRGGAIPALQGEFVFGDFNAQGRLFRATPTGEGLWPTAVLPITDGDSGKLSQLLSMARHEGDLYVLGIGSEGGILARLAPPR